MPYQIKHLLNIVFLVKVGTMMMIIMNIHGTIEYSHRMMKMIITIQ